MSICGSSFPSPKLKVWSQSQRMRQDRWKSPSRSTGWGVGGGRCWSRWFGGVILGVGEGWGIDAVLELAVLAGRLGVGGLREGCLERCEEVRGRGRGRKEEMERGTQTERGLLFGAVGAAVKGLGRRG